MRNIFITRRKHFVEETPQIEYITDGLGRQFPTIESNNTIEIVDNLDLYHEYMKNHDVVGADTENNSLNTINAIPLLAQFAFQEGISFVIDRGSIKEDFLSPYKNKLFLAHNAQYDYMIFKRHYGVELRNWYDTMIVEQIVGRGSGRSNRLDDVYLRRTGKVLPEDKHTRDGFISMTERSLFNTRQIIYAGFDPHCLFEIRNKQEPIIRQYKLEKRVYHIGMGCIPILGDMYLNGFTIDKTKWQTIIDENKANKFRIECELDEIVRQLGKGNKYLTNGIWTNPRKKQELTQIGLFGENTAVSNENLKNISYSSNKQMVYLFTHLKQPIPQKIDRKEIEGQFTKDTKNSFAEEALEQYKIEYPESKVMTFINKLLEYRSYEKALSSFGEIFLNEFVKAGKAKGGKPKYKKGFYNPRTQRVHTIYKQETTKNGRLTSGDVKQGLWQSQNMIKEAKYRNAFTITKEEIDKGYFITTVDLSQAELVILASNSRDRILLDLIKKKEDLHSYLANAGYNRIISYILNSMPEDRAFQEISYLMKPNRLQNSLIKQVDEHTYRDYTPKELGEIHSARINEIFQTRKININKKSHADIRDPAKNAHYGINYGATEGKISETLNIAPYYGKLYLEGIEIAIPQSMKYLKSIANFGVKNGYVVFNDRTNSRHWFKTWLEAKEYGRELSQKDRSSISRACKNYGISGTQADMIKEAMVVLDSYQLERKYNDPSFDFQWLLQVHDEIVVKHTDRNFGKEIEKVIIDTCNLYLKDIEMEVSGHTGYNWHK